MIGKNTKYLAYLKDALEENTANAP